MSKIEQAKPLAKSVELAKEIWRDGDTRFVTERYDEQIAAITAIIDLVLKENLVIIRLLYNQLAHHLNKLPPLLRSARDMEAILKAGDMIDIDKLKGNEGSGEFRIPRGGA